MLTAALTTDTDLEDLLGPRAASRIALGDARLELERRRPSDPRPWQGLAFRMEGDEDGDDDDDDDDDDGDKGKAGKKDDDEDDDDDTDVSDLDKAQAAAARFRREARDARRALEAKETADEKAQGKHKERADRLEKEIEELRGKQAENEARDLLKEALRAAGFKADRLDRGVKLAKADDLLKDVEDEADAKRVARQLAKENPEFVDKRPRTKRSDDDDDEPDTRRRRRPRDDDDEDDDKPTSDRKKLRGTDRIRAHFEDEDKRKKRRG